MKILAVMARNRRAYGCDPRTIPSKKQVIKIISTAPWSKVIKEGDKHHLTEYEFDKGQTDDVP